MKSDKNFNKKHEGSKERVLSEYDNLKARLIKEVINNIKERAYISSRQFRRLIENEDLYCALTSGIYEETKAFILLDDLNNILDCDVENYGN